MSVAIEEYRDTGQPIGLRDIVGREQPLVIRGLCRDWPLVKLANQSDTAFAKGLAALDNGSEVDALLLPSVEDGIIGYNADFDGFNYEHHRVSITRGLQRLAHYSRQEDAPGQRRTHALIGSLESLARSGGHPTLTRRRTGHLRRAGGRFGRALPLRPAAGPLLAHSAAPCRPAVRGLIG